MDDLHIAVFAKPLVAGQVKTRMIPALGAHGAMQLQQKLLWHTLQQAQKTAGTHISLWVGGDPKHPSLQSYKNHFDLNTYPQQGDDLGQRMAHTLKMLTRAYDRVLIVGCDCPLLEARQMRAAAQALKASDPEVVFVPVEDGGYGLVGLGPAAKNSQKTILNALFAGMTWSTKHVMADTRKRLQAINARWAEQPMLWDMDRPEDFYRAQSTGLLKKL